ncbi:MAG: hypothetical protein CVV41_13530 [Candidatus Riflebacteria bacterium HGW-Riflebacteria-1]|jgi:hypothetical protein|nr:MAG: hypothetical protein CVV41_13530 [Candidatus Riflebacteria bacterium HGW-Riflebacteria-1]
MVRLFQTTQQNIGQHLRAIYEENELTPEATYKKILLVRKERPRKVRREIEHYNLYVIISVGYLVKSRIATEFRIWAPQKLKEYIVKGFALNDERFFRKSPGLTFNAGSHFKALLNLASVRQLLYCSI